SPPPGTEPQPKGPATQETPKEDEIESCPMIIPLCPNLFLRVPLRLRASALKTHPQPIFNPKSKPKKRDDKYFQPIFPLFSTKPSNSQTPFANPHANIIPGNKQIVGPDNDCGPKLN